MSTSISLRNRLISMFISLRSRLISMCVSQQEMADSFQHLTITSRTPSSDSIPIVNRWIGGFDSLDDIGSGHDMTEFVLKMWRDLTSVWPLWKVNLSTACTGGLWQAVALKKLFYFFDTILIFRWCKKLLFLLSYNIDLMWS